jgi:hypothetical protein
MWTVSSPIISLHDLACITSWPVRFSVCRVSSTSTPEGGVIASRADCSPDHPATNQAAAARNQPGIRYTTGTGLGARRLWASARAAAEHRLKTATNTASEERQTRNDGMLILKLTAPKQRRPYRCRWGLHIAPTRALFDTSASRYVDAWSRAARWMTSLVSLDKTSGLSANLHTDSFLRRIRGRA